MKFTIVTPSFNSEKFIAETIESVLTQKGDFEIDYIVVDGHSKDQTFQIALDYLSRLQKKDFPIHCRSIQMRCFSEPDDGMYEALNKGFSRGTGDVFAWINADDMYLPNAFQTVAKVLSEYPDVQWCKGITSYIDTNSQLVERGKCFVYFRDWIKKGLYGTELPFIQQDSVFWRRSLWQLAGPINAELRLAGDFFLWTRFAEYAPLYSIDVPLSCFRRSPGQLSQDIKRYWEECSPYVTADSILKDKVRRYLRFESTLPNFIRPLFYRMWFRHKTGPLIRYSEEKPRIQSGHYYLASSHGMEML